MAELVAVSREREMNGSIADIWRLDLPHFQGLETPLQAERWIVDMDSLLGAVHILLESGVDVKKINPTH